MMELNEQIGPYRLLDRLGEGASAVVYRACLTDDPGRQYAVKVTKAVWTEADIETRVRFEREAENLSRLSHDNIVRLERFGVHRDRLYLVMELARGMTLAQILASRQIIDADTAAQLLWGIARGLDHAHQQGILHRDIKPSNVMVSLAGPESAVKILDFGLSRLRDARPAAETLGTYLYMSPEQLGILPQPADERSDLYSLGILAVELLNGRHPFAGQSLRELIHSHAAVAPTLVPETPPGLARIVTALVQKDPVARYQNAAQLAADLALFRDRWRAGDRVPFELRLKEAAPRLRPPRFIGRETELNALLDLHRQAGEGGMRVGVVAGFSGFGKTRLLREAARQWTRSVVLWGRGRSYGHVAGYGVIAEAFRELAAQPLSNETADRLRALGGTRGADFGRLVPELRAWLGEPADVSALSPEQRQERFLSAGVDVARALATPEAPLVLVLDDLQWADEGSLEFIARLAQTAGRLPVLLLLAFRREEWSPGNRLDQLVESIARFVPPARVAIEPLRAEDTGRLVESMVGHPLVEAAEAVAARAEGCPLYAIELMHALVETGALAKTDGGWRVADAAALAEGRFADGARQSVRARVDRLAPGDRDVLRLAAIEGRTFRFANLATALALRDSLSGTDAARRVDQALGALAAARIILRPAGGGPCVFTHDKIQETVLEPIPTATRTDLHRWVALAIEKNEAAGPEKVISLAHHFGRAGLTVPAVSYGIQAGVLAADRHAHREALDLFDQARARLEDVPASEAKKTWEKRLWESVADSSRMIGLYDRALSSYAAALAAAVDEDDGVRLQSKIGRVYLSKGESSLAAAALEGALARLGERVPRNRPALLIALFREALVQAGHTWRAPAGRPVPTPRERQRCVLLNELAHVYFFTSTPRALWAHLRHMNRAESHGVSDQIAQAYANHAPACAVLGWWERGERYAQRGLALREEAGDRWGAAQSRSYWAMVLFSAGRWRRCLEVGRLAEPEFEQLGDRWELVNLLDFLGSAHLYLGDWDQAEACLEKAYRLASSLKHYAGMAYTVRIQAEMRGRVNAQSLLQEVDRLLPQVLAGEDRMAACCLWIARGLILGQLRTWDEAERAFAAAEEIRERHHLRTENTEPYTGWLEVVLERFGETRGAAALKALRRRANRLQKRARHQWSFSVILRENSRPYEALYLWKIGRPRAAEKTWRRSLNWCVENGALASQAIVLRDWGVALREKDATRSAHLLRAAWTLARRMRDKKSLDRIADLLPELKTAANEDSVHSLSASAHASGASSGFIEAERFETLIDLSLQFGAVLDPEPLFQMVVDAAARIFGAERAVLFLRDGATGALVRKAMYRVRAEDENRPISETVLQQVLREERGVLSADAETDENWSAADSVVSAGVHSVMCAPVRHRDRTLGVLYLDNRLVRGLFNTHDLKVLQAFAAQAAAAFANARMFVDQERSRRDLKELYDASRELMGVLDRRLIFKSLLERARSLTGASAAAVALVEEGRPVVRLQRGFSPAALTEIEEVLRSARFSEATEFPLADGKNLQWIPLWAQTALEGILVVGPSPDAGRARSLLAHVAAQCSLALHNARLYELAITDELTQVYQRRYYDMVLRDLVEKKEAFGLILIDLNEFKLINDTLGHAVGDRVLKAVGREMKRCLRASDLPARIGGDEFAVILPGETTDHIERVVEKLRAAFAGIVIDVPDRPPPRVWGSFGYGFSREGDLAALKDLADQRLYEDKRRSKAQRRTP